MDRRKEVYEEVLKWRREFHQHPELSFQEKRTAQTIAAFLKELGLNVIENVYGYGLYADLEGKGEGPTVALRADMDALPISEETGLPFSSIKPQVMHACGHDGHIAALMVAAKQLVRMRNQLKGRIRFIFQPAEELTPGGAKGMMDAGVLEGVDYIFGLHLWSELPSRTFWTTDGAMMAASDKFKITVNGKGGHGAMPHTAIDALLIGSHIVVASQHIVSRQVDPIESGVISFGRINSGTVFNAIADRATLEGTVRSFSAEVRNTLQKLLENTATKIAELYGAFVEVEYERGYPALINHSQQAHDFLDVATSIFGQSHCGWMKPNMAGEDFAYYLEQVPGSFCFVGAAPPLQQVFPHHHPKFNFDENVLPEAVELLCKIALRYVN